MFHLQLKDHVKYAVTTVSLKKLNNVRMFQSVTDAHFPLQIYHQNNQNTVHTTHNLQVK